MCSGAVLHAGADRVPTLPSTALVRECSDWGDLPPPDVIHISPPCRGFSKLGQVSGPRPAVDIDLNEVVHRLCALEHAWKRHRRGALVWQFENVPECLPYLTPENKERVYVLKLAGTMMGHQVVRKRAFLCNYPATCELQNSTSGKWVGSHGLHYSQLNDAQRFAHLPPPNMYGVYSQPGKGRGSLDDWLGAGNTF